LYVLWLVLRIGLTQRVVDAWIRLRKWLLARDCSRRQVSTQRTGDVMTGTEKPPPELLPMRPRCPDCQARMITSALADGPEGLERRTFVCAKCGHTENRTVVYDLLKAGAVDGFEDAWRYLE
jgi:hypothetical protein